ncbi:hypothetical protein LXL04_026147 [Taraxacum kok-saghyz]
MRKSLPELKEHLKHSISRRNLCCRKSLLPEKQNSSRVSRIRRKKPTQIPFLLVDSGLQQPSLNQQKSRGHEWRERCSSLGWRRNRRCCRVRSILSRWSATMVQGGGQDDGGLDMRGDGGGVGRTRVTPPFWSLTRRRRTRASAPPAHPFEVY